MERDGLIVRKKDANDGRMQRIWLTERARALHGPATKAALAENTEALASLSEDEQRQFTLLMQKVIAASKHPKDTNTD